MHRLEANQRELTNLEAATSKYKSNKDNPKYAWSTYYNQDRKKFLDSSNKKEKLERTINELKEKINQQSMSIDNFTKTMEKNDFERAKLADTQQNLITEQIKLTKNEKEKVSFSN